MKKKFNNALAVFMSMSMFVSSTFVMTGRVANAEEGEQNIVNKEYMYTYTPYGNMKEKKYFKEQGKTLKIKKMNYLNVFFSPMMGEYSMFGDMAIDNPKIQPIFNSDLMGLEDFEEEDAKFKFGIFNGGDYTDLSSQLSDEDREKEIEKIRENLSLKHYEWDRVFSYIDENTNYNEPKSGEEVRLVDTEEKDITEASYIDNIFWGNIRKNDDNTYSIDLKVTEKINFINNEKEYKYTFNDENVELSGEPYISGDNETGKVTYKVLNINIGNNLKKDIVIGVNEGNQKTDLKLKIDPSTIGDDDSLSDEITCTALRDMSYPREDQRKDYSKDLLNNYIYQGNSAKVILNICKLSGASAFDRVKYSVDGSDPNENSKNLVVNPYIPQEKIQTCSISINSAMESNQNIKDSSLYDGGKKILKFRVFHGNKPSSNIYKMELNINKKTKDIIESKFNLNNKEYKCAIGQNGADGYKGEEVYYDTKIKTGKLTLSENIRNELKTKNIGRYLPLSVSLVDSDGNPAKLPIKWEEYMTEDTPRVYMGVENIEENSLHPVKNLNKKEIELYKITGEGTLEKIDNAIKTNKNAKKIFLNLEFFNPKEDIIIAEPNSMDSQTEPEDPDTPGENEDNQKNLELKRLIEESKDISLRATKTDEAIASLEKIIKEAEFVLNSNDKNIVRDKENKLKLEIQKTKSDSSLIKDVGTLIKKETIEEGVYNVLVNLRMYANPTESSMGTNAILPKAKLIVDKNGNRKLRFNVVGINYMKSYGHLTTLWYYDTLKDTVGKTVITSNDGNKEDNTDFGNMKDAKVLKETEDIDLNGELRKFPKTIEIDLNTFKSDPKRYIRIRVDAMDGLSDINPYDGNNNMGASKAAILCIDYRFLEKDKNNNMNPEDDVETEKPQDSDNKPSASKAELKSNIDIAEHLIKENFITGVSKRYLEAAIKEAKKVYDNKKADKNDIIMANSLIKFAIMNAKKENINNKETNENNADKKEQEEIIEKNKEKDAILYSVPVKLYKAFDNSESMGNPAIEKKAIVKEKDGKYEYFISFNAMEFSKMRGHLWGLSIYEDGLNSSLKEAKIDKEYQDTDLLGEKRTFPKRFSFIRNKNKEEQIYAQVSVDAMDAIASNGASTYDKIEKGKGKQSARLMFDWNNAKRINEEQKDETVERISGTDRYSTSVEISKKYFKKADTVIVASGRNNADALVSSSLAKVNNAPILLTEKDTIPNSVMTEIKRLEAKKVIIAGGKSSIGEDIERSLKKNNINVSRIAGKDRIETSAMIAQNVRDNTNSKKAIIINGYKEADALSVAGLATKETIPVLMSRDNNLNKVVKEKLNNWNVDELIIIGGESSISDNIKQIAKAKSKKRISGRDRYETAVKIAEQCYPESQTVLIANGENSIDALATGAITYKEKSPILLVKENSVPNSVKNRIKNKNSKNILIFGGKSTISNAIENELKKLNR